MAQPIDEISIPILGQHRFTLFVVFKISNHFMSVKIVFLDIVRGRYISVFVKLSEIKHFLKLLVVQDVSFFVD